MNYRKWQMMTGGQAQPYNTKETFKTIQVYRRQAQQIGYRLKLAQRDKRHLQRIASDKFVSSVDHLLISRATRLILQGELRNIKKKPQGRTWTTEEKLLSLSIYKKSPGTYRFLRLYVTLPCESTLRELLEKISLQAGISPTFIAALKNAMTRFTNLGKYCVLMFDEIYLNSFLFSLSRLCKMRN